MTHFRQQNYWLRPQEWPANLSSETIFLGNALNAVGAAMYALRDWRAAALNPEETVPLRAVRAMVESAIKLGRLAVGGVVPGTSDFQPISRNEWNAIATDDCFRRLWMTREPRGWSMSGETVWLYVNGSGVSRLARQQEERRGKPKTPWQGLSMTSAPRFALKDAALALAVGRGETDVSQSDLDRGIALLLQQLDAGTATAFGIRHGIERAIGLPWHAATTNDQKWADGIGPLVESSLSDDPDKIYEVGKPVASWTSVRVQGVQFAAAPEPAPLSPQREAVIAWLQAFHNGRWPPRLGGERIAKSVVEWPGRPDPTIKSIDRKTVTKMKSENPDGWPNT